VLQPDERLADHVPVRYGESGLLGDKHEASMICGRNLRKLVEA
jgi:hypothetical protein